jgi:hypothetical protein
MFFRCGNDIAVTIGAGGMYGRLDVKVEIRRQRGGLVDDSEEAWRIGRNEKANDQCILMLGSRMYL